MATVKTLPLDYDLQIYTATSYRREFRWLPDGVTGVDFTGWSAIMNIGVPAQTAALTLTNTNGGITLTAAGQIIVQLTPVQTAALKPGVLAYNLDLTNTIADVRRFLRGRVSVIQDVKSAP